MAEFKKYSTPGSFGQNQLKRPSEVAKITKETTRRTRGMQRAQDLEERSRAVYLRVQQFAQSQEQQQRENNFRIETENRQAYKDALARDHRIELQNAQAENATYQKTLQDLTAFSETAGELAVEYANTVKESQDTAAKENIYKAGLTLDGLQALQSLDDNLTKAELFQTQFMQNVIKDQSLSESQKDAYYQIYQGRNTRAYIENKSLLQQEGSTYMGFVDEALSREELKDLPAEEKIALLPQIRAEFLNTPNLKKVRGELLQSSGLYDILRTTENQLRQQLNQIAAKSRADKIEFDLHRTIIEKYNTDRAQGVMALLAENPSKDMRMAIANAFKNAAGAGGANPITSYDIYQLLNAQTNSNGTLIKFVDRFKGDESVALLNQLAKQLDRQEYQDFETQNKVQNARAEKQIRQAIAGFGADGYYDNDEVEAVRAMQATLGTPEYVSPALEEMERLTRDARATDKLRAELKKLANSNLLTTARLESFQINTTLRKEFGKIASNTDKLQKNPELENAVERLRNAVAADPKVAGRVQKGQNLASVDYVQDRFEREFKEKLYLLQLSGQDNPNVLIQMAEADTADRIAKYLKTPGITDGYGRFVEYTKFTQRLSREADSASAKAEAILEALQTPNVDTDPSILVDALSDSREMIINSFDSYQANSTNWAPLPVLQSLGKRLGLDVFEMYNFIAPELDKDPIVPKNDTLQKIKKTLPPHLKRNFDVYPDDNSIARSTAYMYGRTANLPVRPAFEQSGLLPLIRGGESAGNYNAANRGYAGDSPAGIVNLDTLTVASWNAFYSTGWNALGAYQLIRGTFQGAVKRLGLARDTIMDKKTQDLIAIELITGGVKRPALSAYLNGESDDLDAAVKGLYREWAAIATETGDSEYDGLAGNAANVSNDEAREALQRLRQMLTSTQ